MLTLWKRCREKHPGLFYLHLVLRLLVLGLLIWKLAVRAWVHAGLCILVMALFSVPALSRQILHLEIPPVLDGIICLFVVFSDIGGEMFCLYLRFPWWDSALHLLWGFLAGLIGCALMELWQGEKLTPGAAAFCMLSFTALTGVLWEFFEYFMDTVFSTDMQKDVWLSQVSSVLLNPSGDNVASTQEITEILVNGQSWPGLLDVGLTDTMQDMLLNFLGGIASALVFLCQNRSMICADIVHSIKPDSIRRSGRNPDAKRHLSDR